MLRDEPAQYLMLGLLLKRMPCFQPPLKLQPNLPAAFCQYLFSQPGGGQTAGYFGQASYTALPTQGFGIPLQQAHEIDGRPGSLPPPSLSRLPVNIQICPWLYTSCSSPLMLSTWPRKDGRCGSGF